MPDHDRKPAFLHTLRQDPGDEAAARCPSCRGTGVTLQDDCVCCGRGVELGQVPQTEDMTASIKDLRIKTEVDDAPQAVITPAFVEERKPVIPVSSAGPRASNMRQRRSSIPILRPGVGTRYASLGHLQQPNADENSRSSVRIYHQYVVGQPSSSSLTRRAARGSARGSAKGGGRGTIGAHPTYRGVRTRRGVKGYLVEIRPPKWKKTIWLGTYNTSLEAAGAYDAGVFYTKKSNTKYNFGISEGTFPPLPTHLRLDRPENMNAIKLFVQGQAKLAARRMGTSATATATSETKDSIRINQSSSSSSCLTGSGSTSSVSASADLHTASTEVGVEIDSEFEQLPMDLAFLELDHCLQLHDENVAEEAASAMFDYTNYVSQQVDMDFQMLPAEEGDI